MSCITICDNPDCFNSCSNYYGEIYDLTDEFIKAYNFDKGDNLCDECAKEIIKDDNRVFMNEYYEVDIKINKE
jgi:hypothetical protein